MADGCRWWAGDDLQVTAVMVVSPVGVGVVGQHGDRVGAGVLGHGGGVVDGVGGVVVTLVTVTVTVAVSVSAGAVGDGVGEGVGAGEVRGRGCRSARCRRR